MRLCMTWTARFCPFNTADYTYDEETKIYTVNFEGADGYDYHLYFAIGSTYVGYGYNVYAMTREETVESEDGYKVVFERVIASDANLAQGAFYSIKLFKKDGDGGDYVEVESATNIYAPSLSKVYYVLREKTEDGKITSTTYYHDRDYGKNRCRSGFGRGRKESLYSQSH